MVETSYLRTSKYQLLNCYGFFKRHFTLLKSFRQNCICQEKNGKNYSYFLGKMTSIRQKHKIHVFRSFTKFDF